MNNYILVYSTNPIKQEQILKDLEKLGIVIPVPKPRKIKTNA